MTPTRSILVRGATAAVDPDPPANGGYDVLMTLETGTIRSRSLLSPKVAAGLGLQLLVSAVIAWVRSR